MPKNIQIRNRILETAREQFFAYGIHKVTMDEIASLLGMSKKTVYQFFSNKDNLVGAVIERHIITAMRRYAEIMNSTTAYVDKLYNALWLVGRSFSQMGKRFQDDLHRLRPDLWRHIEDIRRLTLFADFIRFIDGGIERGLVRNDIHRDLFLFVYISALQPIASSEFLVGESFSADDASRSLVLLVLDGMLTESGRQQFRNSESYQQLTQRVPL